MTDYCGKNHIVFGNDKAATTRAREAGRSIVDVEKPAIKTVRSHIDIKGQSVKKVVTGAASTVALNRFDEEVLPGVMDLVHDADMKQPLYIDIGQKKVDVDIERRCVFESDIGGCYWHIDWADRPYHQISLPAKKYKDDALLHEMIHAIRDERGAYKPEVDPNNPKYIEEVETILATVATMPPDVFDRLVREAEGARTKKQREMRLGYYGAFTDPVGAMLYDRVLMTGSLEKSIPFAQAHARSIDDDIREQSNISRLWFYFKLWGVRQIDAKTLPDGSARLARLRRSRRTTTGPVYTVRVSTRPSRSKRLAKGAGHRLFYALLWGREVPVQVTQEPSVPKAAVLAYLSKRLGARAVWECQGCTRRRVA